MRRRRFGRWLAVVISLILTVLAAEGLLRVVYSQSMDFDMEMWKYATQVKIASHDPRVGHDHRPHRRAFLMGVEVTTNRFGLRGDETTLEKPVNTYRIVVAGDSITMGWGVAQADTYPAQLERMLNSRPPAGFPRGVRYEVLNLGIGNYNTVQEVTRLRTLGLKFAPDLILLGYFINDAEPVPAARHRVLLERSYLAAFVVSRLRQTPLAHAGSLTYKEYYRGLYADEQPGWRAAQAALVELTALGHARSIPVVAYVIPELHDLSATYAFADIHQKLLRLGAGLRLPVVDLFPVFSGQSPEAALWVSPTDAHPNARAQRMIARGIYDSLAGAVMP